MSAPSYIELLSRNRDFRLLWFGEIVSFFGDWFKTIALLTIVQEITGSAQAVAGVMIAQMLPIFLVIPIAGRVVDGFDRRVVLIVSDVARAVCVVGLIASHHLEDLRLLFVVLFVLVGFSGVFIPARTASIPQLTTERELPVAMALAGGTWSVMLAFGAAAGGAVTQLIGVDGALVLDGVTYLVSAAILWRLPSLPPREAGAAPSAGFFDGLRYLWRRPYLASVLSLKSGMGVAAGALVLLPVYGNGLYVATAGPLFIGVLYAFRGFGALTGSMGVRRVFGDDPATLRALIVPGLLLMGLACAWTAFAPNVWLAGLGFFVAAVGQALVWVFSGTLAQLASDRAYRGRLFSLEFGAMTLVTSIFSWVAAALVDLAGWTPRMVMLASGVAILVPALGWALAMARLGPPVDAPARVIGR